MYAVVTLDSFLLGLMMAAVALLMGFLIYHAFATDVDEPVLGPPTSSRDAVTKGYVDQMCLGAEIRQALASGAFDDNRVVVIEDEPFVTFMEMLDAGDVLWSDIGRFVEHWDLGYRPGNMPLHEYLGMTWDEYTTWAMTGQRPDRGTS